MPFGIKSAPSAFQRIISDILEGLEGVLCYLDDILIAAPDRRTLEIRVAKVRDKLRSREIVINEEKSIHECDRIEWLGHEISEAGAAPLSRNVV